MEKGLKVLAENGSTVCIIELLNIKMKCAEILNDSEAVKICSKYITAFECLYEISDIEYQHLEILSLLESSLLRECINSSEFLKELREANKISHETLSEDICTRETLSHIESGRNLQKKNLYRLWKKIGIQRERYYGQIEAEHYELYEKVRLCNRNMGQDRIEKAYYEKKKIPSLEERYLRNSYYLMKFYNEEYKEKVLKSIYISKFGNDLV